MRVANWNKTRNLLNLQLSTFIFDGYKIRVRHKERDRESLKFPSGGHILKLDLLKSRLEPLIIRKGYTPSNSLYDALKFWQVDQNPNRETLTGRHQIHKSISGWTTDDLKGWVVDAPVNIYDVGPRWHRIVDTLEYMNRSQVPLF